MISQKCPKCRSPRIRRGYRPTPLWSKILFRYNLLCDGCNLEFKGFAMPGTVTSRPNRSPRKKAENIEGTAILKRGTGSKDTKKTLADTAKPKSGKKRRTNINKEAADGADFDGE